MARAGARWAWGTVALLSVGVMIAVGWTTANVAKSQQQAEALRDKVLVAAERSDQLAKEQEHLRMVPVIMQTALAGRDQILEGIRAGAYYYLTKPYDVDMLRSVVRTAVADHQGYRELQSQVKKGFDSLRLLEKAVFTFQTVEQARDLGTLLANACPDPSATVIGLTELLINAVEHGNLGITYEDKSRLSDSGAWNDEVCRRLAMPEHATKRAEVSFERGAGQLRFTIRDQGRGFDWKRYLQVDPQRAFDTHGRGIAMANRLSFSHIEYRGCGNEVVGVVVCPT